MSDKENITMTIDIDCKLIKSYEFVKTDLDITIGILQLSLQVVIPLMEIVGWQKIEDGYFLVELGLRYFMNDVLGDS